MTSSGSYENTKYPITRQRIAFPFPLRLIPMLDTRKKRLFNDIENIRTFLHTLQQEINDLTIVDQQKEE